MAYTIPQPIRTYNNPSAVLPSRVYEDPKEGRRLVPVEIIWPGAATAKSYQVNVAGITTQPFSQIVMIDVDNSLSGASVTFYFPDTQDTLVIPGGEGGLFPVFTQLQECYVSAPNALNGDVTRFRFLNYRQDPIALPPPQFQNIAAASGIVAVGTTAIIPSTVSGTLAGYSVNVGISSAGAGTLGISLLDHQGPVTLDGATIPIAAGQTWAGLIMNVNDLNYRFAGGIDLSVATTGVVTAFIANASLRYRTP